MYAEESVELLRNSGIQFEKHEQVVLRISVRIIPTQIFNQMKKLWCFIAIFFPFQEGINPQNFAEIMIVSGLVLMPPVRWLSFSSGYDFGYLLNLLTNQDLPKTENEFFDILKIYFPCVYDVKYLMKSCKNLKGGLQEVANELDVPRIGPQHQAGSDSLLTGQTFFKMKEMFFEGMIW